MKRTVGIAITNSRSRGSDDRGQELGGEVAAQSETTTTRTTTTTKTTKSAIETSCRRKL